MRGCGVARRAFAGLLPVALLAYGAPAGAESFRLYGNFDLSAEIRRDADAEFDDRQAGFDHPTEANRGKRPFGDLEVFRNLELRMFAYPASPLEIFAKVFQSNDFFLDEAHTKLRVTGGGSGDEERGVETFLYYRQNRLSVGDPLLAIAFDDAKEGPGSGLATTFWLSRGQATVAKGRWSGEANFQNTSGSSFGEDNDAFALKLSHDYRIDTEANWSVEALYSAKKFIDISTPRPRGEAWGAAATYRLRDAFFAAEYLVAAPKTTPASDHDAWALEARNVVLLDRSSVGRVGVNFDYLRYGRNYQNFVGKEPTSVTLGHRIAGGREDGITAQAHRELFGEVFWDVAKYQANLTLRATDRRADGSSISQDLRDSAASVGLSLPPSVSGLLERTYQADFNVGLVKNFDLRLLYTRTKRTRDRFLLDFDAGRFIVPSDRVSHDYLASLRHRTKMTEVRLDYRRLDGNEFVDRDLLAFQGIYRLTKRIQLLLRHQIAWVEGAASAFEVTSRPSDLGGGRTSVVEPFSYRHATFFQVWIRPSDNSQVFLEYGQGFPGDNDLALDSDFLFPGRRTDDRIFVKLEMWF